MYLVYAYWAKHTHKHTVQNKKNSTNVIILQRLEGSQSPVNLVEILHFYYTKKTNWKTVCAYMWGLSVGKYSRDRGHRCLQCWVHVPTFQSCKYRPLTTQNFNSKCRLVYGSNISTQAASNEMLKPLYTHINLLCGREAGSNTHYQDFFFFQPATFYSAF